MNNIPLVSVVIPTHNRPAFLYKTIRSVLTQTYQNLEVIVISNGNNYQNKNAAESFLDKRIIYVEQENSGGPSSPRNHGIRLSKGEYVAFCDDDDLWMPEKIENQVDVLANNIEYGLCYSKMLRFNEKDEWFNPDEEGPASLESLLYSNTVPISSVFIRKNILNTHGGFIENSSVGTAEDYEFLLRYATVTKLYYLDKYLIKYWSGSNRTTLVDLELTIQSCLYYFKGIMGCYYFQIKNKRLSFCKLFMPFLYQIYLLFKRIAYLALS